jgi:hypothetical protein
MKKILLTLSLCCSLCSCHSHEPAITLLDGDLIFQDSQSAQCRAVQLATGSAYSHVGMIIAENGNVLVCEAVQPVKLTPFAEWIRRGRNNHYVVKRLRDQSQWLNAEVIPQLKKEAKSMLGRDYDALFGWEDKRIYCSELIWKAYDRAAGLQLCPLKTLRDFNLSAPEVQKILHQRYGNKIPYEEPVVSPADLFDSKLLVEIVREGKVP